MSLKMREFRPEVQERLEDRIVLSGPGVNMTLGVALGIAPYVDAQAVGNAFAVFENTYNTDVKTVLITGGDFTTAVNNALITLNSAITGALSNLPSATSPASAITGALIGAAKTTMQSRLAALRQPTSAQSHFTRLYIAQSDSIISSVDYQVVQQVANATPPTGTVTVGQFQTVLSKVTSEIQVFAQSYVGNVFNVLLAFPTMNPSTHQAAFNTAVAADLQTMSSNILQDVGAFPSAVVQGLNTSIPNTILSNQTNPANLQDTLASVPEPTTLAYNGLSNFMKGSGKAIIGGAQSIVNEIVIAVKTYNASLPPA